MNTNRTLAKVRGSVAGLAEYLLDRDRPLPVPPDGHYDPWEDYDNPLHPYRSRDLDRI